MSGTRPPITGYRRSAAPGSLLDVLSYDQFRAVIASPPHRAQYGLEVSPATLALLGTDENTAQTFYSDWTRDGQPPLSALPAQAPGLDQPYQARVVAAAPTIAPPASVAPQPAFAPPAAVAPQPAYAPLVQPAHAPVAQPAYAPVAQSPYAPPAQPTYASPAAVAIQPSYAPAMPQSSRDPQSAPTSAPSSYAPLATTSEARPSGSGMRNILIGFGIAVVGTIVTVVSYNATGPGGTFVVAWGAIVFGVIQGLRGIVQQLKG